MVTLSGLSVIELGSVISSTTDIMAIPPQLGL